MTIRSLVTFDEWIAHLRDKKGRAKILGRLRRLEAGNAGDHRGVGEGVMELRIHFGPGYRVYYVQRGETIVIVLCGGRKDTQTADIGRAKQLALQLGEEL